MNARENPFSSDGADRREIWEMLVERDIAGFLARDWDSIRADFAEDRFVGYSGSSNPDHWRIAFPSLNAYRDEWIRQAEIFGGIQLRNEDKAAFLFRATVLRDIEVSEDRAVAHKKFDGRAPAVDGTEVILNWQSVYWLQRISGQWQVTGFLGYLPNPMPQASSEARAEGITVPHGAVRHKTAGPYSPVLNVVSKGLIAISGQGPIDGNGVIVGNTLEEQACITLDNCKHQLETAGAGLRDVFKVTVYLADMAGWDAFNEIYRQYFLPPYPARTAIQAVLWHGIKVEIDMLAISR